MRGLATIIALLGGMLLVAPAASAQDDALEQEARALILASAGLVAALTGILSLRVSERTPTGADQLL